MSNRRIQIERARYDDRHWVKPYANPESNTETRYRVFFEGNEIGIWKDPECSAARYLVDHGLASRADMLEIYRGDRLSMTGKLGWFADYRVDEGDSGKKDGTPRFVKWRPHPFALLRGDGEKPTSDDLEAP